MVKAIQHVNLKGGLTYVLHSNIQKIGDREYMCNCCGMSWKESITSPIVLTDDEANELGKYYPMEKVELCTKH